MAQLLDEALCVRHWDWSETSQTVSLFTREHGLLRGLAKGARREKGTFSGGFEVLTRGEIAAIVKSGRGLATLTAWDLRETFQGFRRSLRAHYAGMYVVDLVQHMLTEDDPHPGLYDRTVVALRELQRDPGQARGARALVVYQLALLDETGYRPELELDARTGEEVAAADLYGFSPDLGGLVADPGPEVAGIWRVRAETAELLRRLQSEASAPLGETAQTGDEGFEVLWRANRLLAAYIREKLGEEPRSMRLLMDAFPRHGEGEVPEALPA